MKCYIKGQGSENGTINGKQNHGGESGLPEVAALRRKERPAPDHSGKKNIASSSPTLWLQKHISVQTVG